MYTRDHLLISVAVGGLAAYLLAGLSTRALLLVGYAAVVGVGIDLDHFALARLNTGSWRAARRCLRDPHVPLFEQDRVFEGGEVGTLQRLFSHAVLAGIAVGALAPLDPSLSVLTAVVLYAHLVADLYADNQERGTLPWTRGTGNRRTP